LCNPLGGFFSNLVKKDLRDFLWYLTFCLNERRFIIISEKKFKINFNENKETFANKMNFYKLTTPNLFYKQNSLIFQPINILMIHFPFLNFMNSLWFKDLSNLLFSQYQFL
jgi:hypothetical protein